MILLGILYGGFTGRMEELTAEALNSAQSAVSLCITTSGVLAMWMGLMRIAQNSGLIDKMTGALSPVLTFLFPKLPKEHPARGYIAMNIIANMLGLGWACTPAGLKGMEELRKEAGKKLKPGEELTTASDEMCDFLILNISSLQLVPVNIIAYRSQYGSNNPAEILAPALAATAISTLVAIVFILLRRTFGRTGRREK